MEGDDVKYNEIEVRVMRRHQIGVDDLHIQTRSFGRKYSSGRGDVHFTPVGYEAIGCQAVEQINAALSR
jgi:hypothetical protein